MDQVRALLSTVVATKGDVIKEVQAIPTKMEVVLPGKTISARNGADLIAQLLAIVKSDS